MLLRTPGHTTGNQTLFVNTGAGVWGVSENGTAADNWSPLDSKIPGLPAICRKQDLDIVLNANTPENGADQYTSMVLEKTHRWPPETRPGLRADVPFERGDAERHFRRASSPPCFIER